MFKAVLFDADETIFNNQGIHLHVTELILDSLKMPNNLAKEVHAKWDSFYFKEQNRLMEEVGFCIDRDNAARSLILALEKHGKKITYEEANDFYTFMVKTYSEKSKPYPDALKLIDVLEQKNIKMAIVSNGDLETIEKRLEKANLENHFEFIIAPCEKYPLTKPDIKIFQTSLAKINAAAETTMFIGDNPLSDIAGANQVGMFSVLIDRYGIFNELTGLQVPNKKISSFEEIIPLFS